LRPAIRIYQVPIRIAAALAAEFARFGAGHAAAGWLYRANLADPASVGD
jgi:hypothetical protein